MVIDLAPWASRRWLGRQPPIGAEIETRTGAVLDSLAGEPHGDALWETVRRRVADEVLLPLWREVACWGRRPKRRGSSAATG